MRPPFLLTSTQFIKGVGPVLGQRLKKVGLSRFWDILAHIPKSYTIYTRESLIPDIAVCLDVTCYKMMGRRAPWRLVCQTGQGREIDLVFFHPPKMALPVASKWRVKGILTVSQGRLQIIHPHELTPWVPGDPRLISPHYTLAKGLSSISFSKWVKAILDLWPLQLEGPPGYDPSWPPWKEAFSRAHFPVQEEDTLPQAIWRQRLAFDEVVAHHLSHFRAQTHYTSHSTQALCGDDTQISLFLTKFGHPLTVSQTKAWQTISQELSRTTPMMRLLHGDVGSGKTIVAFLALLQAVCSGKQACLMAPTETLIRQHYDHLCRWSDIPAQLILGKGKRIGPKEAPLILGTHALFHKEDLFSSLGLVVIDEQHRFGVLQRLALINKGQCPHLLLLSATPIPRTFERLLWGQMEVSPLEKRPSPTPLKSYVLSCERIPELKEWIERCIQRRERVYWVCPAIEDDIQGVLSRSAYWETHFPGQVACLHGQMTSSEKEGVIEAFRLGDTPFLVTTTVIEVGIHVAEASTMIIEDSPRFGLSQLHQLRGRVGRDHIPGHCFFLYTAPISPPMRARLTFMRHCHNGFEIAEKDWSLRGSGVLLGTQQSGFTTYHFFDTDLHHAFIEQSFTYAKTLEQDSLKSALLLDLFNYESCDVLKAG